MWTPRAIYSLFFIFLLAIALPVSSAGNTLYVSPAGSDGNPCSSPNLPCREIRRALQLVVAGDTILVADGSYKGFDVRDLHGDAGRPITIKAQGTNAVIQKTTDRPDNRDTVFITFSSYIVVDGLRSFNANRAALRVDQSPKVVIRNGVFGNNATWGIFTDFSDDLLIENNETYGSISQHGIYVSNSGDRPIVRGNRSHDNRGCGIHMNADVNSGGDGIIIGALIENNIVYNNGVGGGAGINMDGVQDSVVRNNVLYNNHATGIALFQIDGAEGPKGNKVYHNTVHQASDGRWALLIWRAWGNNTVRNNVLYHPNPARGGINFLSNADVVATDSDYNVLDRITPDDAGTLYTLAQWKLQGHETHSLSATPTSLFINAAGGDFHLAAGSPAIDRGLTLPDVTRDRDGNQRPLGAASDIGAYEAGGVPTPSPSLTVTPSSLAFGSVNVGSVKDLTVTVKNVSGGTLTGSASTSAPFTVLAPASYSLAANQSAVLTVRFSPTAAGAITRNLSLTGGAGASVSLSGTGVATTPVLSVTPTSLAFGSVNIGSSKNLTVTVKNVGGGTLTGSASTSAPFTVVAPASYSLAANQSAVLTVRFSPTVAGAVSRNLSLTGGTGRLVSLSGTGVATTPVLSVTPTSLAFGSVNIGSSKNLTVTVKNVGGGTLTGSAATSAPFTVVAPASYSLAANQSAVLTVRFSPTAAGAVSRNLSLTGGTGRLVSLSGTGVATTPVLSVTPTSLAFGSNNVGSIKDLRVTVKNVGGGTLTGSASTSAPFTVVAPASYSLAAGQSILLTVRFSPTAAGAFSRNLSLTGGAGASVSLTGTGVSTTPAPGYWAENRPPAGGPRSLPKQLFPTNNWWNQDISGAPVDPKSSTYTAALGAAKLMYDWGNNYGLPYVTVSGNYPKVRFAGGSYWSESDDVDYPIPIPALTQPGWTEELTATLAEMPGKMDRHLLIVDVDNQRLYEIYQPFYNAGTTPVRWGSSGTGPLVYPGQYYCAGAATWDLRSNNTRPEGWTSSDAAGLQVLPGLVQYDEVTGTEPIKHAHRLTLNFAANTQPYYVWPATHAAGNWSNVHPPLGARFRLKASKDISRFGPHAQKLLQSMKTYGVIFADNGTNGLITGTNDPRWGNYDSPIRTEFAVALTSLTFADFEVISLGWRGTAPVLTVTPASLPFGSVNVGSSKNLTVTVKNVGGGTLTGSASASAPFAVVAPASYSLAANQSAVLTVRFSPTAAGAVSRNLSLTGGAGASVSLSGTGVATTPVLSVTPTSLAFGSVNVGSIKNLTVTVKNVGGGILAGSASTSAPFAVVAPASYSLASNQTAVLTVRFSPTAAGAFSRNLSLTGGAGASVSLSGTGVATTPVLSVTPTSLAFGSVNVGSIKDLKVTVKNVGGGTLTGSASTSAPFTVVAPASYSLAASQSIILTVRFSPTVAGAVSRNLSFTGGAGASGSLSGAGVLPTVLPIPELAQWEAEMLTYGRRHCALYDDPTLTADQKLGSTYYDATRVFHQIADYTSDPAWKSCAAKARAVYRDAYVIPNHGGVPGYWNFTTGLRMDWERTGDPLSKSAVIELSRNAAFAADVTPIEWTARAGLSREVAYSILSYLNAEAMGEPKRARRDAHVEQAFGHIDQWFISKSSRAPVPFNEVPDAAGKYYIQPFMVGLTTQALIHYWEVTGDARVLPAVKTALDAIWERAWVPTDQAFWYQNWVSDPASSFPAQPGAPDLNLLIAPAFAWVYRQTGDTTYRDRGDQIFAGGVKGAWLDGPKQFNQNYMWSFAYVKWRSGK